MSTADIFKKALARRHDLDQRAAKAAADAGTADAASLAARQKEQDYQHKLDFYMKAFAAMYLTPAVQASQGLLSVQQRDNRTLTLGTADAFRILDAASRMLKSDGRDFCDAIDFYFDLDDRNTPHLAIQPLNPKGMMRGAAADIMDKTQIENAIGLFMGEILDEATLQRLAAPPTPAP